jgi:hypothetical protein
MYVPLLVRESAPSTTPPSNVTAMIVVPRLMSRMYSASVI